MRFTWIVECKSYASRRLCQPAVVQNERVGSQTPVNLCEFESVFIESRNASESRAFYFHFKTSVFIVFPAFPWILCCQNVQNCCVNKLRSVQQTAHWSSLKIEIEKINTKSVLNCVYKWLGIVLLYIWIRPEKFIRKRRKRKIIAQTRVYMKNSFTNWIVSVIRSLSVKKK